MTSVLMTLKNVVSFLAVLFVIVASFFSCQGRLRSLEQMNLDEENSGQGRSTPRAPDSLDRRVVIAPVPSGDSQRRPFQATALSDYVFPVVTGQLGSMWCVCRSVGTSPHVGQDINSGPSGREVSVAISNGAVLDVTFDESCGWSVWFEDSHQSAWRYVHLNRPHVKVGDIVTRGQVLGSHSEYPKSSCGTGPHLHLERRSPGVHASPEEFRSCQYGRSSCYYSPNAVIEKARILRSEKEARDLMVAETKVVAALAALGGSENTEKGCRRVLRSLLLEPFQLLEIEGLPEDSEVEAVVSVGEANGLLTLSVVPAANPSNSCRAKECVEAWQLFFEDETGMVQQMLSVPGAGDRLLSLGADVGACVALEVARSGRLFFVLRWSSGLVTRVEATLSQSTR